MSTVADRAGDESPRGGVQSIDRAVSLLRCFTAQRPELSLSALAQQSGLSTSTTYRLLSSLQQNGLVRQTASRAYRLGPLILRLAGTLQVSSGLRDVALPIMRELRDETDETVGLHTLLPDNTRTVVDQVESHQPLRRKYTEIGESIPLHQGAPGKLLLAFLPADERDEVLARPLGKATAATPTEPARIRAELATIRRRGYSVSLGERVPGIRTVAAPITVDADRVESCISVSGPETRMSEQRLKVIGGQAVDAARRIAALLGAAH
ncbi:MAG TPA: IclR family transcriptional regulator [Pseudonocardiaceae bacterium]|nr:IclR family transcriptional regulator [Pseudonocardiaceae bacterium]